MCGAYKKPGILLKKASKSRYCRNFRGIKIALIHQTNEPMWLVFWFICITFFSFFTISP
jgi:hypothetical protein